MILESFDIAFLARAAPKGREMKGIQNDGQWCHMTNGRISGSSERNCGVEFLLFSCQPRVRYWNL